MTTNHKSYAKTHRVLAYDSELGYYLGGMWTRMEAWQMARGDVPLHLEVASWLELSGMIGPSPRRSPEFLNWVVARPTLYPVDGAQVTVFQEPPAWAPQNTTTVAKAMQPFGKACDRLKMAYSIGFFFVDIVPEAMCLDGSYWRIFRESPGYFGPAGEKSSWFLDEVCRDPKEQARQALKADWFVPASMIGKSFTYDPYSWDRALSSKVDKAALAQVASPVASASAERSAGKCTKCGKPTSQKFCWGCLHDGGPVAK